MVRLEKGSRREGPARDSLKAWPFAGTIRELVKVVSKEKQGLTRVLEEHWGTHVKMDCELGAAAHISNLSTGLQSKYQAR